MVRANTEPVTGSFFTKVWTARFSALGSLRRWAVARRHFLEGPDAGYRGRRPLSLLAGLSNSPPALFSHAFSSNGRLYVSSALLVRGNATLAAEQTTSDILTSENLAGELDIEEDDPELLAIELDKSDGTAVSDSAPSLEEYDRYARVVTMKDAERVFSRANAPRDGYDKEAADYQRR